jgi:hypothetical protein
MTLLEYFKSISLNEITEFVENKTPEDLYLDFKVANFPHDLNFDNKNFSKCLSGFANSLGGLIIWGIKASKNKNGVDAAKELKPIKDLRKFENYLKRNEGKTVVPIIEGIEYKRIEENKDEGYLVVYIPQSDRAPHMAQFSEKHYYKRSGDSFYICEHFDIMDMLNRKVTPKLIVKIINEKLSFERLRNEEYERFEGILCIENIGQSSAKHIVLTLDVKNPYSISSYGLDGIHNRGMNMMRIKANLPKYIGGADLVLHPETYHEVDRVVLNELGFNTKRLNDLKIEYTIIAEGMKLTTGIIDIKKDEILSKTST